jgi:hypothetical protein
MSIEKESWPKGSEVKVCPPHRPIVDLKKVRENIIPRRRVICDFKCCSDPVTGTNAFDAANRDGWSGRTGRNENDCDQKENGR